MDTATQRTPVTITVNGETRHVQIEPWVTLLDYLREQLYLTGTKKGCDHGQCGACTVIIDGKRMNSCLQLVVARDGATVTTIEGLSTDEQLNPLQEAFLEHDAFQCGYCTPGQICSATALMQYGDSPSGPPPLETRAEIRELMSGNLCRCGAYTNIVDAISSVLGRGGPDGREQEKVEVIAL